MNINAKHFIIRLLIVAVVCIGSIVAVHISTPESALTPDGFPDRHGGDPVLGSLILTFLESVAATIWFVIEAVVWQIRKNKGKRNSSLLLLLLIVAVWVFIYVQIHVFNNIY
jgi:hypothetical protein